MSVPFLSLRSSLPSSSSACTRLGLLPPSRTRGQVFLRCVSNSGRRSSSDSSSRAKRCRQTGSGFQRAGITATTAATDQPLRPFPLTRTRCFSSAAASESASTALFGDTVIVTKRCAERLNELREAKAQPMLRLRLSVEGGGCSGFQYKFSLEDGAGAGAGAGGGAEAQDDDVLDDEEDSDDEDDGDVDHEFERDGAVLVVDATSLELVKGATVDFEEDMMRSAFTVLNNPVSESACGCGSSFALKNFAKNPALD